MPEDQFIVREDVRPPTDQPPSKEKQSAGDSGGFGLVNWLFDHIKDRKPIFLSLYQQYDQDVKIGSVHKILGSVMLFIAIVFDVLLFLIYALAVIAIIVGITFIFIKGTGLLDYLHDLV